MFLLRPPIILFLTASGRENKEAIESISWSIGPWRMVHLLAPDNSDRGADAAMWERASRQHGVRQREREDWQVVVHELMDFVPVIIFDARQITEAVVAETKRILSSSKLSNKCIAIVGDDGGQPALLQAANEMTERRVVPIQVTKFGHVGEAITQRIDAMRR